MILFSKCLSLLDDFHESLSQSVHIIHIIHLVNDLLPILIVNGPILNLITKLYDLAFALEVMFFPHKDLKQVG
jgi:hypothetical protein